MDGSNAQPAGSLDVEVNVQHPGDFIKPESLMRAVRAVARRYDVDRGSISLGVVDDDAMHEMNRRFLNHDYTTDVLSFAYHESGDVLNGELVLCADYAARSAAEIGWLPESELTLYAVHGMLHLMGLDDLSDAGRDEMRSEEREILEQLGVPHAACHGKSATSSSD